MSPLWVHHETGAIIAKNGILCNSEEYPCECPPPDGCPCAGAWPPAAWPCGGLVETYAVSFNITKSWFFEVPRETQYIGSGTVTAVSGNGSCYWTSSVLFSPGTVTGTVINTIDGVAGDPQEGEILFRLSLDTAAAQWQSLIGPPVSSGAFAIRTIGLTPIGAYMPGSTSNDGSVSIS